jgi:hypothetical protein
MNSGQVAFNQMQKKRIRFRYETSGRWYKGSMHLHTVSSDGHLTLDELVQSTMVFWLRIEFFLCFTWA